VASDPILIILFALAAGADKQKNIIMENITVNFKFHYFLK